MKTRKHNTAPPPQITSPENLASISGTAAVFTNESAVEFHFEDGRLFRIPAIGVSPRMVPAPFDMVVADAASVIPKVLRAGVFPCEVFCVRSAEFSIGRASKEYTLSDILERYPTESGSLADSLLSARAVLLKSHSPCMAREMSAARSAAVISFRGVPFDSDIAERVKDVSLAIIDETDRLLANKLRIPHPVNPGSVRSGIVSLLKVELAPDVLTSFTRGDAAAIREIGDSSGDETAIEVADLLDKRISAMTDYIFCSDLLSSYYAQGAPDHPPVLHTSYDSCGSATGRWTSSAPCLHNIPKGNILHAFRARPGWCFVKVDYSQEDPRVAGAVIPEVHGNSGDPTLRELFRNPNFDPYRYVGGILMPDGEKDLVRQAGKFAVCSLIYNASPARLRQTAKEQYGIFVTAETAKKWRDVFFSRFPEIKQWQESCRMLSRSQDGLTFRALREASAHGDRFLPLIGASANWHFDPQLAAASCVKVPPRTPSAVRKVVGWLVLYWLACGELPSSLKDVDAGTMSDASRIVEPLLADLPSGKGGISSLDYPPFVETPAGRPIPVPFYDGASWWDRQKCLTNYVIQGAGADILKEAISKLETPSKKGGLFREKGLSTRIVATTHDDIVLLCKESEATESVEILSNVMRNAVFTCLPGSDIAIPVSVSVGASFAELSGVPLLPDIGQKSAPPPLWLSWTPSIKAKQPEKTEDSGTRKEGVFADIELAEKCVSCQWVMRYFARLNYKTDYLPFGNLRQVGEPLVDITGSHAPGWEFTKNPFRDDSVGKSFRMGFWGGRYGYHDSAYPRSNLQDKSLAYICSGSSFRLFQSLWAIVNKVSPTVFLTKGATNPLSPRNSLYPSFCSALKDYLGAVGEPYPDFGRSREGMIDLAKDQTYIKWRSAAIMRSEDHSLHVYAEKKSRRQSLPESARYPSEEDIELISAARGFSKKTIRFLSDMGHILCADYNAAGTSSETGEIPGWMLLDSARWTVQSRRCDGRSWIVDSGLAEPVKSMNQKNSSVEWVLGAGEASVPECKLVAVCEGGPDFVAAYDFLREARSAHPKMIQKGTVRVVSVLGAGGGFDERIAAALGGKKIVIFPHCDEAVKSGKTIGENASARWAKELGSGVILRVSEICAQIKSDWEKLGGELLPLDPNTFPDPATGKVAPVKDINDLLLRYRWYLSDPRYKPYHDQAERLFDPAILFPLDAPPQKCGEGGVCLDIQISRRKPFDDDRRDNSPHDSNGP